MVSVDGVKVKLDGTRRFREVVSRGGGAPENRAVLTQWAVRWRSFAQRRFAKLSKGGGEWPKLAESTVRGRRGNSDVILRDTNTLFAGLNPAPSDGAYEEVSPDGFTVICGYGGPSRHPKGGVSIADIASFHQAGGPNLPQRRIIVQPDVQTINSMAGDMERHLKRLGRELTEGS